MTTEHLDRVIAHHEAAHAVVNYRTAGFSDDLVSIVPDPDQGTIGHTRDALSDSSSPEDMMGRILSCYAGGHAQRRLDPSTGTDGCDQDDDIAHQLLWQFGWEAREQELRDQSAALVNKHWIEIVAVATELLRVRVLDNTEVETIADIVCGEAEAIDLAQYRALRDSARRSGDR
jgi:hypothetical protein